jgi:stress response protein YsnF
MSKTLVAVYDESTTAQQVINDLSAAGFQRDSVTVMDGHGAGQYGAFARPQEQDRIDSLTDLGVSYEDAGSYAEAVRRGATLVAVVAPDEDVDNVMAILERHGPIDLDARMAYWRETGWTEFDRTAPLYTTEQTTAERERYRTGELREGEEAVIPVVEEEVKVGKRAVERGRTRIHTRVEERPVEETVRLRDEEVTVERRPTDRPVRAGEAAEAFREGSVEVTETDEEAVISKEPRVVEEVRVHKDTKEHEETVHERARRTDVEVEKERPGEHRRKP